MNAPAEKLAADARILASDVDELLRATAAQTGETIAAARGRAQTALANAKDTIVVQGRDAAKATDRYIRDNAWTSLGVAAGVALLLGILIGRR